MPRSSGSAKPSVTARRPSPSRNCFPPIPSRAFPFGPESTPLSEPTPRLPPGQVETRKWPVLHSGLVPRMDLAQWKLRVWGDVETPLEVSWDDLQGFPRTGTRCDIHCVTQWSRFDNAFEGGPVSALLRRAQPRAAA